MNHGKITEILVIFNSMLVIDKEWLISSYDAGIYSCSFGEMPFIFSNEQYGTFKSLHLNINKSS